MTDLDLTALQEMREKPKKGRKKAPEWEPLNLASLHPGTYLAADPSLTAFGLVLFEVGPEQHYAVHMAETFKTEEEATGWEDTLQRTQTMQVILTTWITRWVSTHDWGHVRAVHEAPPVGGGKLNRPEATLMTGYAFRQALRTSFTDRRYALTLLPMVRRQDHAKLICGNANADKKVHHAALKEHFDALRGADELITNEAKRDALSVALTAAKRGF